MSSIKPERLDSPTAQPHSSTQPERDVTYHRGYIFAVAIAAALGGLMFGYDWVVIGGAELFYEKYFHLQNPIQIGWAMSSALIGALLGATGAGIMSDRFGRKRTLLASGLLFVVTSLGTGLSPSFSIFIFSRLLGGVAIGIASNLSPLYIAEIAPANMRGRLVSVNQLTIALGLMAAQIVNWMIAQPMPAGASIAQLSIDSWNVQVAWRWMFVFTALPASVFFIATMFIPESPRWMVRQGLHRKAQAVLARIGGASYAERVIREIEASLASDGHAAAFAELCSPKMLKVLALGIFLALLQQWCGINVIYQYGARVFADAGFGVSGIMFNILVTGIVSVVMTFIAIGTVDSWGRRALMLSGTLGLAVIYLATGMAYHAHWTGLAPVVLVVAAIACYCYSLAPITWVILSEIFPNRTRGAALSCSTAALWAGNFLLSQTFPLMYARLGMARCFWTYSAICLTGFLILLFRLPETKGKTLEQIEHELVS